MKHAYLIIAHNEFEILKKLVSLLDNEHNDIYIHFDAKVATLPIIETTKSQLYILKKRIDVRWADYSQVETEMTLLQEAFSKLRYDYFHIISGVDLPIKPQNYIHKFFEKNRGKEFIDYCLFGFTDKMNRNAKMWHLFPKDFKNIGRLSIFKRIFRAAFIRIQQIFGLKRNKNIDFRTGSNWVSITAEFTEYLLSRKDNIRKTYTHTFCADEIFIQTECWNSEFRNNLYDYSENYRGHMRLIDWGRGTPYTWQNNDYEELMQSDRLFARKFSSENMEIVDRIAASIK
ncbi:MAG: glycosyl transferase [Bacteroidaceae bacterium]|nr:glycosyl transferase [Bacteroidaceae bacterium]